MNNIVIFLKASEEAVRVTEAPGENEKSNDSGAAYEICMSSCTTVRRRISAGISG